MAYAFITIVAPLALTKVPDAEQAIDAMGNPAIAEIAAALDKRSGDNGTHFASMHAVRSQDGVNAWLVLEFSADGSDDEALDRLLGAIGDRLRTIFTFASDWSDGGDLKQYLMKHNVVPGCGWFSHPGVVFSATPDIAVGRILREARLAAQVTDVLGSLPGSMSGLDRVEAVRKNVANSDLASALQVADADKPYVAPTTLAIVGILLRSFFTTYLWPAIVLLFVVSLWGGIRSAQGSQDILHAVEWFGLGVGLCCFVFLVVLAGVVIAAYFALRNQEKNDWVDDRASDRETIIEMFARENRCAQNHMISITRRKPGVVRWFTSRLVFWVIGQFAAKVFPPGFLSDIGTIHFARWVTVPKSRDILFLSNYDASWESYLEDFITRAHAGLTGVWSNSIGFPKSENLIQGGATDGEQFKRYARRSMVPTRFWYSAYPMLAMTGIRTNSEIRRGLSGVMTEDDARNWLALSGSAARPESDLVGSEIQSLIFGGLGFMPFGFCLLFRMPDDVGTARTWLRTVYPHIAFNNGRRLGAKAVVTLALGPRGLKRLGLAEEGLSTFPFAYLEGMTAEYRARILGDKPGEHGRWQWDDTRYDVVLLAYGWTQSAVDELVAELRDHAGAAGIGDCHTIPLTPIPQKGEPKNEPFGFRDGISQPVIRGTYKALRNPDSIHLVEPGEFILGYPDNRGNMPPGPTLPAIADPENRLPLVGEYVDFDRTQVEDVRDLGMNGSFLVIRQLEQNVKGFDDYCAEQADRLKHRLPLPYHVNSEFIAAKLIGRWRDGSSLARHPYKSQADEAKKFEIKETARPEAKTAIATPVAAAPKASVDPDDNDFLFGVEDPEGIRCPFGAHIRRANPRDSLDPGSAEQVAISNRHRIIRLGRGYANEAGSNPGLLFMCLNGDIERQFEFVQQTWLLRPTFHGLVCEKDPILGNAEKGACSYTIPSREGPIQLAPMPAFVKTLGGGYFFIPGKRLIDYLAA